MYYIFVENGKINGSGECECLTEGFENIEVTEEVYNAFIEDNDLYIWDGSAIVPNPNYEEIKRQKERERLDALTLTPADVERALYKAKGMDFEDLKALIAEKAPQLDMKALAIEFRANNFYRGVEVNGMRLIDTVGALLGYTPADMVYLFTHKELPNNAEVV
jgi:hypothetical protein